MTLQQKVKLYGRLLDVLGKGVSLAAVLHAQGQTAARKKVEKANEDLATTITKLRGRIHQQWLGQASAKLDGLSKASRKLQRQIRRIEKTRATAKQVMTALGYIDEAIDIAKQVLAAA